MSVDGNDRQSRAAYGAGVQARLVSWEPRWTAPGLTVTADRCYRCEGELPRSSHLFIVLDGVTVPFCREDCWRATDRELPFDVDQISVQITAEWPRER